MGRLAYGSARHGGSAPSSPSATPRGYAERLVSLLRGFAGYGVSR
jgi:hypothetical protein